MKAILTFELPEERDAFLLASSQADAARAVGDFRQWLRQKRKHAAVPPTLDEVWDELHAILSEYNLTDEVIG